VECSDGGLRWLDVCGPRSHLRPLATIPLLKAALDCEAHPLEALHLLVEDGHGVAGRSTAWAKQFVEHRRRFVDVSVRVSPNGDWRVR
jgi:hypothetical protein